MNLAVINNHIRILMEFYQVFTKSTNFSFKISIVERKKMTMKRILKKFLKIKRNIIQAKMERVPVKKKYLLHQIWTLIIRRVEINLTRISKILVIVKQILIKVLRSILIKRISHEIWARNQRIRGMLMIDSFENSNQNQIKL